MIKTITIGERDIMLSNNMSWAFIYNDQFGHDVVVDVMPMIAGLIKTVGGILEEAGGGTITLEKIAAVVNSDAFDDAYIYFATMKLTDIINITWAMAKVVDDTLPEPKRWIRDVGEFPVDEIFPAVYDLLINSMVSAKNRERLRRKDPQPEKQ